MNIILLIIILILILNVCNVESRQLQIIELYTDDERCNELGFCYDMHYADQNVVVRFNHKPQIRFTSSRTYKVKESKEYFTLTFVNSKFSNFPLQLFQVFDIKELDFRNCSLKTLKMESFLNACQLDILLLSDNLLTKIQAKQFSKAKNLNLLMLGNNRIKDLHPKSFKGLKKLSYLDLHHNLIEVLPRDIFSQLERLKQINLAENRLMIIKQNLFINNPQLYSIQLSHNLLNEIQDYAFQNQQQLNNLDISYNPQLEVFVSTNLKVEYLWAKNCSLKRINIYGEVYHLDLQHNFVKELYFSKPELLESLILKDNKLEQISILAHSSNLKTLDISDNSQLKSLSDLWKINSLESLNASNITLREIPPYIFSTPHKLRYLNISFNQIEEINPLIFKSLKKLSEFYIHHNNWNCYNLQMIMDKMIKPLKISYTRDVYEKHFPGKYIRGIKCFNRGEQSFNSYEESSKSSEMFNHNQELFVAKKYNYINLNNIQNVKEFRNGLKIAVGKYDQTFSLIMEKLNDLDERLKGFEIFNNNQNFWQRSSIVV